MLFFSFLFFFSFFFFCCWLSLGLVVRSRLDDSFVSQNPEETMSILLSRTGFGLWIYHLFVCSNLNFVFTIVVLAFLPSFTRSSPRILGDENSNYMHSMFQLLFIYLFIYSASFDCYFSHLTERTFRKKGAVPKSAIFCIFHGLKLPDIMLMCLFVFLLYYT